MTNTAKSVRVVEGAGAVVEAVAMDPSEVTEYRGRAGIPSMRDHSARER
jgi:hypothetical protein